MSTNEEIRNNCTRNLFQMHHYMNDKQEARKAIQYLIDSKHAWIDDNLEDQYVSTLNRHLSANNLTLGDFSNG